MPAMVDPQITGPDYGQSRLTIDLAAIVANYQTLAKMGDAETAVVVKADAYGLGARYVTPALYEAGARTFFTAQLDEAIAVRQLYADVRIYVLNGIKPQEIPIAHTHNILPVLGSETQFKDWIEFHQAQQKLAQAALHVETGINRMALSAEALRQIAQTTPLDQFQPTLILSHLANADTADNPSNAEQLQRFTALEKIYPRCPRSLAASYGIYLGKAYHFDMVRAGIALYGGIKTFGKANAIQNAVTLDGYIMQVHSLEKGQKVGYGGTFIAPRNMKIAVLAVGYADGYARKLSNRAICHYNGVACSIIGRVSMDMITIDVSHIDTISEGETICLLGPNYDINAMAQDGETISYEILTSLGRRFVRVYSR